MLFKSPTKTLLSFVLILILGLQGNAQTNAQNKSKWVSVQFFVSEFMKDFHGQHKYQKMIFVSLFDQKLYEISNSKVINAYDISSSKYGVGFTKGSKKTPMGLHSVGKKLGAGCPENGVIQTGWCNGKIASIITEPKPGPEDLITSRILWLKGKEQGVNAGGKIDTYYRNIYIHGTPEEGLIGKKASHGCIRMRNKDVIKLFKNTPVNTLVLILNI